MMGVMRDKEAVCVIDTLTRVHCMQVNILPASTLKHLAWIDVGCTTSTSSNNLLPTLPHSSIFRSMQMDSSFLHAKESARLQQQANKFSLSLSFLERQKFMFVVSSNWNKWGDFMTGDRLHVFIGSPQPPTHFSIGSMGSVNDEVSNGEQWPCAAFSLSPFWQPIFHQTHSPTSTVTIASAVREMTPIITLVISQASGSTTPSLLLTNMAPFQTAGWPLLNWISSCTCKDEGLGC